MKTLTLLLIFSFSAQAGLKDYFSSEKAQNLCKKYVYANGSRIYKNIKFVKATKDFVYYAVRDGNNSVVLKRGITNSTEQDFKLEGRITNIQFFGEEIAILTEREMIVLNIQTNDLVLKIPTLPQTLQYKRYAYARGVYKYNDIYYIAHGIHGISVYDSQKEKFLPTLKPSVPQPMDGLISMITDIVGIDQKIYITYDDYNLSRQGKGFEGLMIYDIERQEMIKTIPVKQSLEAYYQSNLTLDNEELVVTNLHLNFRHKLAKLMTDKYMKPLKRIWIYPAGEVVGRGHIENKTIYGCFYSHKTKLATSGSFEL